MAVRRGLWNNTEIGDHRKCDERISEENGAGTGIAGGRDCDPAQGNPAVR